MKRIFSLLLLMVFLLNACAPAQFIPRKSLKVEFEETPKYEVDLTKIPKPEKLEPIFVDENFEKVENAKDAKFVLLVPQEYAKISGLLKLCKAYKDVIKEQEVLVNINIDIINSLKEYIALEQAKAQEYQNLWANAENAYRHEQYYHKLDNAINKGTFTALAIGIICALIAL